MISYYTDINLYTIQYKYHRLLNDETLFNRNNLKLFFLGSTIIANCLRTKIENFISPFKHCVIITLHHENVGYATQLKQGIALMSFSGTTTLSDIKVSMDTSMIYVKEGKFHKGYFLYVQRIIKQIITYIKNYNIRTLYLTGHSFGGAIASIVMYFLKDYPIRIYTFTYGCPKYCTASIKQYVSSKSINYLNTADPVIYKPLNHELTRLGINKYYTIDTGNDNVNHSIHVYKYCLLKEPYTKHRPHRVIELILRALLDIFG